eukprot:COSAG03_NODE_1711_length_3618_cov_65.223643_5_plen_84_part_00
MPLVLKCATRVSFSDVSYDQLIATSVKLPAAAQTAATNGHMLSIRWSHLVTISLASSRGNFELTSGTCSGVGMLQFVTYECVR